MRFVAWVWAGQAAWRARCSEVVVVVVGAAVEWGEEVVDADGGADANAGGASGTPLVARSMVA